MRRADGRGAADAACDPQRLEEPLRRRNVHADVEGGGAHAAGRQQQRGVLGAGAAPSEPRRRRRPDRAGRRGDQAAAVPEDLVDVALLERPPPVRALELPARAAQRARPRPAPPPLSRPRASLPSSSPSSPSSPSAPPPGARWRRKCRWYGGTQRPTCTR